MLFVPRAVVVAVAIVTAIVILIGMASASASASDGETKESGRGEQRRCMASREENGRVVEAGGNGDSTAVAGRAVAGTGSEGEGRQEGNEDAKTQTKKRDAGAKLESMLTHAFYYLAQVRLPCRVDSGRG